MFCPDCGTWNRALAATCSRCGNGLPDVTGAPLEKPDDEITALRRATGNRYRILRRLQVQRQATLVVVTHDRRFITPDDLVLEIQDGQLKDYAASEPQDDLAEAEVGLEPLLGGGDVLEGKDAVEDRANEPTT